MRTAIRSWDRQDGYLTVFMALILPLVLSLYFALLQGARMNASRLEVTCAADAAADAAMAEFSAALFSRYDLFFIDTSYGTGASSDAALEARLNYYFERNLEPSAVFSLLGKGSFTGLSGAGVFLTGTRYAGDLDCLPVREQIHAYMSADPAGSLSADLTGIIDLWEGLPLDAGGWTGRMDGTGKAVKELFEKSGSSGEEAEDPEETPAENPFSEYDAFRAQPVLDQVFGRDAEISPAGTDLSLLFSHKERHGGTGLFTENSHSEPAASPLVLDAYLAEKCGCYGNVREGSHLLYQLEYILQGKDTDRANLEKTLEQLLMIRWVLNGLFLLEDGVKQAELNAAASSLALSFAVPEFEPLVKTALLAAWSYLESIRDLKILTRGGRIPLMKTGESWGTSLEGIRHMETDGHGTAEGEGLDYGVYLQILLYAKAMPVRMARLADIMETDLRKTPGNAHFRMDACLDAFAMEAQAADSLGFVYTAVRNVTYN